MIFRRCAAINLIGGNLNMKRYDKYLEKHPFITAVSTLLFWLFYFEVIVTYFSSHSDFVRDLLEIIGILIPIVLAVKLFRLDMKKGK